jgi:hypothetical protein
MNDRYRLPHHQYMRQRNPAETPAKQIMDVTTLAATGIIGVGLLGGIAGAFKKP